MSEKQKNELIILFVLMLTVMFIITQVKVWELILPLTIINGIVGFRIGYILSGRRNR